MTTDRWITFDCFGTLIDWLAGYRAILAPIAGARTDELIHAYHRFEQPTEAQTPHRLYREVLTTALELGARDIGVPLPAGAADVLARQWGDLPLYSDVPKALAELRADGWKIGILTNCDDALFARTVERFPDLRPDLLVTAEQVRSYKPSFGHFIRFEQTSGVLRPNWVHAAVSWLHDIEPARRFGMASIWVNRDRTTHDPAVASRVLPDVRDLAKTAGELVA